MSNVAEQTLTSAQALLRLSTIAFGFVNSQALLSACQLGLFDLLADSPLPLDRVAADAGIKPVACRRLLMALASLDLVAHEDGMFRLTELGRFCSKRSAVELGKISNVNPFFHMSEYLTDALREYGPRFQQALGTTPQNAFAGLYADPARLREFAQLMNALSVPQGELIADAYDFAPHACLMDVAGGPGGQSIAIGLKHRHLRGIVMDLPPVCAVADEYIQASGLTGRFSTAAADLMDGPYPAGADVLLLGHILHDWSDETCRKILRHCFDALPEHGVLLLSESVLGENGEGSNLTLVKDLLMLLANEPDARERTEPEYRALLDGAGFDLLEVIRMDAPRDLIVARKR